jgi:outer membrane receptor protein involved in Fe transport
VAPALRLDAVGPFTGLSGKLGASWLLADGWSVRASAGRSFRAPSLAELHFQQGLVIPNPELVPEAGLAADASLVADGPLGLATLGGHVTRYRDLILYQPTTLRRLKPFNTGQALVAGIEAELATAPMLGPARATLSGAYTFLFTELLQGRPDEVGNQVPYRPRHRLYARATAAPGRFELHLETHYVGRRFSTTRNEYPIPASLLWNVGAGVTLHRAVGLSLHAEVKNLLDDRTLTDGLGNPLPSRMVLLTLRAGSSPTTLAEGTP